MFHHRDCGSVESHRNRADAINWASRGPGPRGPSRARERAGRGVADCSHGPDEIANIETPDMTTICDIISGEFEFESGGDVHTRTKRGSPPGRV